MAAWQRGELAEAERLLLDVVGQRWAPGEGFLAGRPPPFAPALVPDP